MADNGNQDSVANDDYKKTSDESGTAGSPPAGSADEVPFTTSEIEQVVNECYRIAFSLTHLESPLPDDHVPVLDAISKSLDESVYERDYFPRRPMLLPRLSPLDPRSASSPWWSIQNIQLTHRGRNGLEVYGGVKNLLNWSR